MEKGDIKQFRHLMDFLSKQCLDYPNYNQWLEKTEFEISLGTKSALIAYSDKSIAGDIVWQFHKTIPLLVELKNIRISEKVRERYFASFMLKQVEWSVKECCSGLIVDCRENQLEMKSFLANQGFVPIAVLNLYEKCKKDVCLVKFFDQKRDPAEIKSYFVR